MATHSSALAWRIPGMAEPGGLPSMGSHRVGHDWSDLAGAAANNFYIFICLFILVLASTDFCFELMAFSAGLMWNPPVIFWKDFTKTFSFGRLGWMVAAEKQEQFNEHQSLRLNSSLLKEAGQGDLHTWSYFFLIYNSGPFNIPFN